MWSNKIPVKLMLSENSIGNETEPFPLYTFFRRVHHPIFYYKKIHDYFAKFAPVPRNENDVWLEWNDKAVSWNVPFGLTFDLHYKDDCSKGEMGEDESCVDNCKKSDANEDATIFTPFYPIVIIVHYGPCEIESELLPFE